MMIKIEEQVSEFSTRIKSKAGRESTGTPSLSVPPLSFFTTRLHNKSECTDTGH